DSPGVISERAWERGASQVGTLGSGNHFLEFGVVEEVVDPLAAAAFGLRQGMVTVLIHTGSRGFGHQVATDFIELFRRRHLERVRGFDPQLIHAPIESNEGQKYLAALAAAANFAFANRQAIQLRLEEILERSFAGSRERLGIRLVFDQAHNIAKFETHTVAGEERRLLVHRKGATRAYPAGSPEIPAEYRPVGQPVILPGSMGASSWILRGSAAAMELTFGSAAHGAGRRLSRHQALRHPASAGVRERLLGRGIRVFSFSSEGLREEIPEAYKEIDDVVAATEGAGLAARVARIRPLVVIKG
ncbi:MAG TPA: RtcB family protein, partial [Candidatus Aminicenantes bacterium]|nr:RtcB family protein [Candidatus Aminicenantes bacterium]